MTHENRSRLTAHLLAGLAFSLLLPAPVRAQAWLPEKGQWSVSLLQQNSDVGYHLFSVDVDGTQGFQDRENGADLGDVRSQSTLLGMEYGALNWLAINGDVAYVSSKYSGDFPESNRDDGSYHSELQDVRLALRFAALKTPVALTPYVGFSYPTQKYDHHSHVAVGRSLAEAAVGFSLGRTFSPAMPRLYFQGNYTYTFVEKIERISSNRVNGGLELGYFVTDNIGLKVFAGWQKTYGGLDWWTDDDPQLEHLHDAAAKSNYSRIGAGLSWATTAKMDIFASYSMTLQGSNTHELSSLSLGANWSMGRVRE